MNETLNKIKTGAAKEFKIEVRNNPQGYGEQWARTETKWNKKFIEWCDWRPMAVAKANLIDFLMEEGKSENESKEIVKKLNGIKWGQMKPGKKFNLKN